MNNFKDNLANIDAQIGLLKIQRQNIVDIIQKTCKHSSIACVPTPDDDDSWDDVGGWAFPLFLCLDCGKESINSFDCEFRDDVDEFNEDNISMYITYEDFFRLGVR